MAWASWCFLSWCSGYSVVLSAYPAQQNVANVTMSVYVTRMVRWLRLRLNMLTIVAAFFEPMIECLNLGLLMALSMRYFFAVSMLTTLGVHISVWMILDYCLLRCVQVPPPLCEGTIAALHLLLILLWQTPNWNFRITGFTIVSNWHCITLVVRMKGI